MKRFCRLAASAFMSGIALVFCISAIAQDLRTCFLIRSENEYPLKDFKKLIEQELFANQIKCEGSEHNKHKLEVSYSCDKANEKTFSVFGKTFLEVVNKYPSVSRLDRTFAAAGDAIQLAQSEFVSTVVMTTSACLSTCVAHSCGTGISQCWKPGSICRVRC